jgi:hypothetical protein
MRFAVCLAVLLLVTTAHAQQPAAKRAEIQRLGDWCKLTAYRYRANPDAATLAKIKEELAKREKLWKIQATTSSVYVNDNGELAILVQQRFKQPIVYVEPGYRDNSVNEVTIYGWQIHTIASKHKIVGHQAGYMGDQQMKTFVGF